MGLFVFLLMLAGTACATDLEASIIEAVPSSAAVPSSTAPSNGVGLEAPVTELIPETPSYIMGRGETWAELLVSFLLHENNDADSSFVEQLAAYYIREAEIEGVNHDIAFAQMCLETGFLRFGNLVVPEMNNFAGLGAIGPGEHGVWFPSVEIGVRAHIQHLKAYASVEPMQRELVTPRYRFVRRGSAPAIQGLAGTWAADPLYAEKIENILRRLYVFRDQYYESKTPH